MALSYSTSSGMPKFYSVVGKQFHFAPIPDGSYTAVLIYFTKIPALSTAQTTNWLLTDHPDAYLYGACKHAAIRLRDIDAAQGYDNQFQLAMQGINKQANRIRMGGPMATRPA